MGLEPDNTKHSWLPQMTADYPYILKNLGLYGVPFEIVNVDPKQLKPVGKLLNADKVKEYEEAIKGKKPVSPSFISENDEILDGKHRAYAFKYSPVKSVQCIRLKCDTPTAARMLNKIQDKYDFEHGNEDNDKVLDYYKPRKVEVEKPLDEATGGKPNPKTFVVYTNKPIKPGSNPKTGHHGIFENKKNFEHKHTIAFKNVYEHTTNDDPKQMIEGLCAEWFPEGLERYKKEADQHALTLEAYMNRKIVDEGRARGYDAIVYHSKKGQPKMIHMF